MIETRHLPHSVEPGLAQLSGWLVLAAVNAIFIVTSVELTAAWPVQLTYHLYAAGQLLGLGLLAAGAIEVWRRWGPKQRSVAYAALTLAAVGVGLLTVPPDLDNFISRSELAPVAVIALFVTVAAADPQELTTLAESLPDAESQLGLLDAFFAARREEHPRRARR